MVNTFETILVAALDEHRVIGHRGELPWRLPADLRHFKQVTMGHPLVMGRRTHESIGKPLPGRENIVLSRNPDFTAPGCTVATSLDEAYDCVESLDASRAMIIGGASLFHRTLPEADRMFLTLVVGTYPGDTFFPPFDSDEWTVANRQLHPADDDNEAPMVFVELKANDEPPHTVGKPKGPGPLPTVLRNCIPADF